MPPLEGFSDPPKCSFTGCENLAYHDLKIATPPGPFKAEEGEFNVKICKECKLRIVDALYKGDK